MDTVLIIVAAVAVIVVAALFLMRGRGGRREASLEERREEKSPAASAPPASVKPPQREERATVARETPAPAVAEPVAVAEEAAAPPPVVEKPRPQVTEAEIRDQVRKQLEAAERMLGELREAASSTAVEDLSQSSVEIMAEGLQEVRALAERKQWGQAKNKGEALHAQLSLLLQSARRETAS